MGDLTVLQISKTSQDHEASTLSVVTNKKDPYSVVPEVGMSRPHLLNRGVVGIVGLHGKTQLIPRPLDRDRSEV